MKAIFSSTAVVGGAILPVISAFPQPVTAASAAADPRFTQYAAPGPGDVRSPCPGLNTLANHGFIHRDGRNMTVPHLINGLDAGLNMGVDFSTAIGGGGILSSPNPSGESFNLDNLDEHNFPIEHDASLSRRDYYFAHDDHSFYNPNWQMVLSYYNGMSQTSIPVASHAKYSRLNDSMKRNPTLVYGVREFALSYGETALYLASMASNPANPGSGVAQVNYVKSLFEQEKLPYDLGWRRPTVPITLALLGKMSLQLSQNSPEPGPEGLLVTADTLKDVWEGLDPLTGKLANGLRGVKF